MAYNLRDIDERPNCLNCRFFQSWADYYEDDEEYSDCGLCDFQGDVSVGDLMICDNHTNKD